MNYIERFELFIMNFWKICVASLVRSCEDVSYMRPSASLSDFLPFTRMLKPSDDLINFNLWPGKGRHTWLTAYKHDTKFNCPTTVQGHSNIFISFSPMSIHNFEKLFHCWGWKRTALVFFNACRKFLNF